MRPLSLYHSVLCCFLIVLSSGCGDTSSGKSAAREPYLNAPVARVGVQETQGEKETAGQPIGTDTVGRMFIRNGNLTFSTPDLDKTVSALVKAVDSLGGYLGAEQRSESDYRRSARLKVRIPAERFDVLIDRISMLEGSVVHYRSEVEDVTESYMDMEARANQLLILEERYLSLLSNARAVTDVLSIEKELSETRTRIEQLQGQLKYIRSRVRYSTLEIECHQEIKREQTNFWGRFGRNLVRGWGYFTSFILWLVSIWPFVLLFTGLIIFISWRIRMRRPHSI